ncbi:MAG: MFS transporter, partial [Chloroflexi bacterium]|nr:MFS transporter [Chloroflexota bacterium]
MIALDALRQPGFALVWISTSINFSAYFLRSTIQGWLVLQLTNSSTWVGLVNGLPV